MSITQEEADAILAKTSLVTGLTLGACCFCMCASAAFVMSHKHERFEQFHKVLFVWAAWNLVGVIANGVAFVLIDVLRDFFGDRVANTFVGVSATELVWSLVVAGVNFFAITQDTLAWCTATLVVNAIDFILLIISIALLVTIGIGVDYTDIISWSISLIVVLFVFAQTKLYRDAIIERDEKGTRLEDEESAGQVEPSPITIN